MTAKTSNTFELIIKQEESIVDVLKKHSSKLPPCYCEFKLVNTKYLSHEIYKKQGNGGWRFTK